MSPGRTGRGHRSSSAPAPIEPPAILSSLSTISLIVRAAVCQPLATRPPKKARRGRLLVEMKWLRVELRGKRLDLRRR